MKRATLFSFSQRGAQLAQRICAALKDWQVEALAPKGNLKECVSQRFSAVDALIFVGACGIAVRSIAPLVRDKRLDPAVIAVDERGQFVIPLLSGHIGGANNLARHLAAEIGAVAVITTATDINGRFSVDDWASRHGLWISDMKIAKAFSAGILTEDMPLYCDFPIEGPLPPGVVRSEGGACGVAISCKSVSPFENTLLLTPKILHLGIGCKKNTPLEKIQRAVDGALALGSYVKQAVCDVGTIDIKAQEAGLIAYCAESGLALRCYPAEVLRACPGQFQASEFVQRTVGVDNVCERSAVCAAGPGAQIVVHKQCADGVTVAIAQEEWSVSFE